jgi:hypothetical protein
LPITDRAVGDRARHEVFAGEVIGVKRLGMAGGGVQLIDGDPLPLAEFLVEIAPVGREV